MTPMRRLLVVAAILCSCSAYSQTHYVAGHFTKSGKYIAGHYVKDRSGSGSKMQAEGRHKETRSYPGHISENGTYVEPHTRQVWVSSKPKMPVTPHAPTGPKKTAAQRRAEKIAAGQHQEPTQYPGHAAPDGHYIPPHTGKVWVKSSESAKPSQTGAKGTDPTPTTTIQPTPEKKPRKSEEQVESEMKAAGRHREHRYYPEHQGKDGHTIKAHWQWVWVKD